MRGAATAKERIGPMATFGPARFDQIVCDVVALSNWDRPEGVSPPAVQRLLPGDVWPWRAELVQGANLRCQIRPSTSSPRPCVSWQHTQGGAHP